MAPKLVAVIGTTGVGKSQLGVELALHLKRLRAGGEVINADSMQVYRGLDIITNKVTAEEQQGIPHHLMGFLDSSKNYYVHQFQQDALNTIQQLEQRNTVPILVGGTAYYVQNVIFENQLVGGDIQVANGEDSRRVNATPLTRQDPNQKPASLNDDNERWSKLPDDLQKRILHDLNDAQRAVLSVLDQLPHSSSCYAFPQGFPLDLLEERLQDPLNFSLELYGILEILDPENAQRWHWKDIRKVRRSLDLVLKGKTLDVIIREQEQEQKSRFKTLIFWLYAEPNALDVRLDQRVDTMVEKGLVDEIKKMHELSNVKDTSFGVLQSIGYKEFYPYLENQSPEQKEILFKEGIQATKNSTRQYSRSQVRWIRRKLMPCVLKDNQVSIYLLDATDLRHWNENVKDRAIDILESFLNDKELPDPASLSKVARAEFENSTIDISPQAIQNKKCDTCTLDPSRPFLVNLADWSSHITSKTHRRCLKIASKRQAYEKWLEQQKLLELEQSKST